MQHRAARISLLIALAASSVACGKETVYRSSHQPGSPEHRVVALNGNVYDTYELQARVGDTVLFENTARDGAHSFAIEGTGIDSGALEGPNGQFRFQVRLESGEYDYRCTVIPYMVGGQLIVD